MLDEYQKKRDFTRTAEPRPQEKEGKGDLTFVVQKHAARRLHYDFRLEVDGVLKSWAVPAGPSLDPAVKRLAVMVEDHPLDYSSFEGNIPEGEYGAGQVIIWDQGTYASDDEGRLPVTDRGQSQALMREGLEKGKLAFTLRGAKLKGSWALVNMQHGKNDWLLIKHRDEFAQKDDARPGARDILKEETSVLSGLTLADLKNGTVKADPGSIDLPKISGMNRAPFPVKLSPMLANVSKAPFSDPGWIFEPKLDGYRILAFCHNGAVKLLSRNGLDLSVQYPRLVKDLLQQPQKEMVLDGEVVALDEHGKPCFQCLQNHLRGREIGRGEGTGVKSVLVYYIFDIPYLAGFDLTQVPLLQRKKLLTASLKVTDNLRLVDYYEGEGKTLFETAIDLGFEGVMAKLKDSPYEAGWRSANWLKIKSSLSEDFIIGGFTRGLGNRAASFGSLLLGKDDGSGKLQFEGQAGSGFDDEILSELRSRLDSLKSPVSLFKGAVPLETGVTFVRPKLVAEIKFAERTQDGYLRDPVFLGLREDKSPAEITTDVNAPDPPPDPPYKLSADRTEKNKPGSAARKTKPAKTGRKPETVAPDLLEKLEAKSDNLEVTVSGFKVTLTHLQKELWPPFQGQAALTKRDLLLYLASVAPFLLPHLRDRPLTLSRYPDGIRGLQFYQRHPDHPVPDFVRRAPLAEHGGEAREYLVCDNLATLLWLGQMATIELHPWFSRVGPDDPQSQYPDFIVFDLDPYIYAGSETAGAEPELNRRAFEQTCRVALWLKEALDGLTLPSFVKTSGRTGLHIFVPILPRFEYSEVHAAARTIATFLLQKHPQEITLEWSVEKRRGKIFIDYNQNVRSKTLASVYSPRAAPQAPVSTPLKWSEIASVYPPQFTLLTLPSRLTATGDLWESILARRADLGRVLKMSGE